ncbi:MAG: 50S ribosomal protein L3 [Candidatus Micrarchaeia archaeon]
MHRGSLQYWQKRRASRRLPRLRSAPKIAEQSLSDIIAYKVGMSHLGIMDTSDSATKNTEIVRACTVLEVPQMEVYGIRLYKKDENFYEKASGEVYSKAIASKLKIKNIKNDESKLPELRNRIGEYSDVRALVVAYPKSVGMGKHVVRFESRIGGKSMQEKFDFAASMLGKEVTAQQFFKNGEYVDVSSITKGKGWQGPIKRFGTARLSHKATQKVRHIGTLGPFKPPKVMFTVPQAGQLGFNYRTEHNKMILKIGSKSEAAQINKPGGFTNYGLVSSDFIIVDGSVPGPAKRIVRIRKAIRMGAAKAIKEPKVTFIAK